MARRKSPTEIAKDNAKSGVDNAISDYSRLTREYENLPNIPSLRLAFRKNHPNWWAKYQSAQGGGTTGGNGNQPPKTDPDEETPEEETEDEEDEDRPPMPSTPAGPGYEWTWNGNQWVQTRNSGGQEALRAELQTILDQFGLNTQGNMALLEKAIREDWSATKFVQEMRQSPDYLANPLFAANVERAKRGEGFLPEGQVIAWATEAKRIAKQFGFQQPSDAYLAQGFGGGLSMAEIEHRFRVQERVNTFGGGVALIYKNITGDDPSDEDLYKIFDQEMSTEEFDRAARRAEYQGRPFTLGLGIRTEAEARALEMMGVNPDEAFSRYSTVAQESSRFSRLSTIEDLVAQGLPESFGQDLSTQENSLLIRGILFQDQSALAQLQNVMAREASRWKAKSAVTGQQGQLTGLLSDEQKASYG